MVSVARQYRRTGDGRRGRKGTGPSAEERRSGSRIVVLLSGKEERTDHGAGFHRLAGSVEVVEVAAAGMSTVVAVNSVTG